MYKKLLSIFICMGLAASLFAGCAGQPSEANLKLYQEGMAYTETEKGTPAPVYARSYEFLGGEDVMPIGGFYAPYASGGSRDGNDAANFLSDDIFQKISECGVNMMFFSVDRWTEGEANNSLVDTINLCEKYGIGYFIDSFYVLNQLGTRTEDYPLENMPLATEEGKLRLAAMIDDMTDGGTKKSVLGILGTDEPFTSQMDNLSVLHDAFYGLDNTEGMDIYINAIGYWAGVNTLYGYSDPIAYDQYILQYFEQVQPAMLSVTQYPFNEKQTPVERVVELLFDRLSVYRKYANQYEVPFWRMLQAGGQWNDLAQWIDSVEPYPSEGEMLLDVNASLAYGAKAIQYFPLIQPLHFSYQTGGTYDYQNRNGLIGADGNLTRWYYYAKRANEQIKAIDEYLMHAANMAVIIHGDRAVEDIVTNGLPGTEVTTRGKFRQLTSVAGGDCIVGCFDYYGGTALYVVNYSTTECTDVTLTFDREDYRYRVIQRAVSCDVVGGEIPLTLDAGEGALIVLS